MTSGVARAFAQEAVLPAEASPAPTDDDIGRWIAELGHDRYEVRQAASEQLLAAGYAARPDLLEICDAPDPEVRASARRLVALIEQSEFSRRLAEFAADVDGRRGVTLPGWQEFSDLIGRDQAARELFVEMQRSESQFLAQTFAEPDGLRHINWDLQVTRLQKWPLPGTRRELLAPFGTCATLYFLGSLEGAALSDNAALYLVQSAARPPMNEALEPQRGQPAVRRLFAEWLVRCPSRREDVLSNRLAMLLHYELAEALPLAVSVVQNDGDFPSVRSGHQVLAVQLIGRFGSAEHVAVVERLLDDGTRIVPPGETNPSERSSYSVEMRDIALATLLHLTGQNPKDYGFMRARRHASTVFDPHSLGMESAARRAAALAQWREWRAANPLAADEPR